MNKIVTAAEANRDFSKLLKSVKDGDTVVVTSHGTPIAKIVPINDTLAAREEAKRKMLERMRNQPAMNIGKWTRDELYDD